MNTSLKPQASVNLEVRASKVARGGRELMLHVALPDMKEESLGWYRYDDSDNRVEIACLLAKYLISHNFTGDISLGAIGQDSNVALTCELFQSELREVYYHGTIKKSNLEGVRG